MRSVKYLILTFIALFLTESALSQRSRNGGKNYKRSQQKYKMPKFRGQKSKTICPVFETSSYPYHGLGFKFGDPFALTYKFYPNRRFSIALDFGKASSGLYNRYFREKFQEYALEGDTLSENSSITYSSHQIKSDLIGECKFLYHIEASKISPGLQVYIGAGWEWKNTRISYGYDYMRTSSTGEDLIIDEFRVFPQQRSTMGPQAVLGIEYAYFQIPISAFMELEYFSDIQADPGRQRFEGGVGLRYIF